jgi:RNA polymerase sigma factor (sigma-70 family)
MLMLDNPILGRNRRTGKPCSVSPAHRRIAGQCSHTAGLVHNIYVSYLPDLISSEASAAPAMLQAGDAYLQQCIELIAHCHGAAPSDAAASRVSAERAFNVLYDQTVQRVHALVRRFVKDEATAQEVTEDVFFMAWSQAKRFDATRGGALAWLLTIARSKALDAWRQLAARWVHYDSELADDQLAQLATPGGPSDICEAIDQQHALHAALHNVPPAARQMISLAFFQGLTHAEISAHLGLPLGTVKTTIRRALVSMRAVLQERLGADMPAGLAALEQQGNDHE